MQDTTEAYILGGQSVNVSVIRVSVSDFKIQYEVKYILYKLSGRILYGITSGYREGLAFVNSLPNQN